MALIKKIDKYIYINAGLGWTDPDSNAGFYLREDLRDILPGWSDEDIFEVYRLASQNS